MGATTRHHITAFLLTFVCFSLFHATRKAFSNVKDNFSKEWTPTSCNASWPCPYPHKIWSSHTLFGAYSDAEPFLGILDTVFLFSYALGLYISGFLGDRFQLRIVLSVGMWLSAITVFLFGTLTEWLHFYNKPFYVVIWCFNGLFQSSGWPSVVGIVGNWFGKDHRGILFGFWSANAAFGNIIGSLISSALVDYGYEVVFLYASVSLFCGGFVAFFGIVDSPADIGLEMPSTKQHDPAADIDDFPSSRNPAIEKSDREDVSLIAVRTKQKPINFFSAVLLPGVITYALTFASLKLINYSFILWLPYYLTNNFGWSDSSADQLSVWYDVGSIVGGITFGIISDWSGKRAPTLMFMVCAAPFAIWGYEESPNSKALNGLLMAVVGLFIGGASNIVGTAVTADIGKQEAVAKDTDALATVTGIIDGTGSVGAAIGQLLVAFIQSRAGWKWVFFSFIIEIGFVILCLLPPFIKEVKSMDVTTRFCRWHADLTERSHEE